MTLKNLISYTFLDGLKDMESIEKIILFGSRARGDHRPKSDIDFAFVCPKATEEEWLKIVDFIENADTLLKIDCVRFDTLALTSLLRKNILEDGEVLYEKTCSKA